MSAFRSTVFWLIWRSVGSRSCSLQVLSKASSVSSSAVSAASWVIKAELRGKRHNGTLPELLLMLKQVALLLVFSLLTELLLGLLLRLLLGLLQELLVGLLLKLLPKMKLLPNLLNEPLLELLLPPMAPSALGPIRSGGGGGSGSSCSCSCCSC